MTKNEEPVQSEILAVHQNIRLSSGVFSKGHIKAGEILGTITGYVVPDATRHSICLDGIHIEPVSPYRYLNHSCVANSICEGIFLVALRDIPPGEEVTIDYFVTEKVISHPFMCECGAATCHGFIGTGRS